MLNKEAQKRKIPNFFDGITTKEKWEEKRNEIKELFLREEYGFLPEKITPTVTEEQQYIGFAGKGDWKSVFFTFEKEEKSHTVRTELVLPKGKTSVPVFVFIDFEAGVPNKYLPMEEILDNGYGVMMFCYKNVTSDDNDFTNGLCALFASSEGKCSFGKISLWAYMASACLDYLKSRNDIGKIAVLGHSRLGKTALLASALDDRFDLTCVNNSGCCGASISRGKIDKNENITKITDTFPFWFCDNYFKYRDNENMLPFDQHMLLSLVAPRPVMIGGAIDDVWADNEGQMLSCYLASPIWKLYGKDGFISENRLPLLGDHFLDGDICFHLRQGEHFLSRYDWNVYMKKFKEIFHIYHSANGEIC